MHLMQTYDHIKVWGQVESHVKVIRW